MSTLKCGRSSTTGPSPPVNSRYRPPTAGPAGPYRPTVWPAVQVPGEHRREQVGGQASIPIVWSLVIWRSWPPRIWNTRSSPTWASPARPLENSIAVSVVPVPARAAHAVGDSNSQRPAYATSSCSCRTRLVSDEAAAARVDSAVISARRFRIPGPPRQPRTPPPSLRCASAGREANPQNVRSPRLPSRRDRKASDTGITNDERGTGTGRHGSCQLTSPCTQATTSPTSPPARAAAAAPGPCRTTPRPGNRPGSGPGRAPRRSG